jgi:antitoxin ParD1/3/4
MTTLNISLPETMRAFVEEEVTAGSYSTVSEYIRTLIREAQDRKAREELERKLLESLGGEAREMDAGDWERLRARVRQLALETRRS